MVDSKQEQFRTPLKELKTKNTFSRISGEIISRFNGKYFRPFLIAVIMLIVTLQVLFLSPRSLENFKEKKPIQSETLFRSDIETLATGIPKGAIPDYNVQQFNYVCSQNSVRQWKLLAETASMYNNEKIVHARKIVAHLYDDEGNITLVTGKEAKYFTDQKDLEIFGNVVTLFPDGFETQSEYMRYYPRSGKIEIPDQYAVSGNSTDKKPEMDPNVALHPSKKGGATPETNEPVLLTMSDGMSTQSGSNSTNVAPSNSHPSQNDSQNLAFNSMGMDFDRSTGIIILLKDSKVKTTSKKVADTHSIDPSGVSEETTIYSDTATIDRTTQIAKFTMFKHRKPTERFVKITQPNLYAQSRRADLNYGNFSKVLNYLVAYDDVLINEFEPILPTKPNTPRKVSRFGTGGKAEFDTQKNIIVLKEYPQVYQGDDTMIGDVIRMFRDSDLVEVDNSNAFSSGKSE